PQIIQTMHLMSKIFIRMERYEEALKLHQELLEVYKRNKDSVYIKSILLDVQRYRPNFDLHYAEHLIKRFKLDKKKQLKKFSKGMQSAFNVIVGLASRAEV